MIIDTRMRELINNRGPVFMVNRASILGDYERAVYLNPEIDPLVSKIIIRKNDYTYHVRAYFKDQFTYIRGNMFLAQHRIFEPESNMLDSNYSFSIETKDLRLLGTAIQELVRISSGLQRHLNNIESRFFINMNQAYELPENIPTWDHVRTHNSARNAMTDEFRNIRNSRKIMKIDLLHESTRACHNIQVRFSTHEHYEALRSQLVENHTISGRENDVLRNTIILFVDHNNPRSIQRSKDFIAQLRSFDTTIDEEMARILLRETAPIATSVNADIHVSDDDDIYSFLDRILPRTTDPVRFERGTESHANEAARASFSGFYARALQQFGRRDNTLENALNQSFAEHYGHTGATYRPSQSAASAPTSPDAGANAKALAEVDIDVPDHLTCPLSLEIMTNPVRFRGLSSEQCFEEAWIMEYLRGSNAHPLTRETVDITMLITDLAIKRECDAFTKTEVQKDLTSSNKMNY
jgi:hypothetical protein